MSHDFIKTDRGMKARYSKDGKTACTGVGKVMDYARYLGEKWSKCSVEDFISYFNSNGGSKSFCLMPATGKRRKLEPKDYEQNLKNLLTILTSDAPSECKNEYGKYAYGDAKCEKSAENGDCKPGGIRAKSTRKNCAKACKLCCKSYYANICCIFRYVLK